MEPIYGFLADVMVALHFAFTVFVIALPFLVLIGQRREWRWTRNYWLRIVHAGSFAFVLAEAWIGIPCPLTVWEHALRKLAGEPSEGGEFIARWLNRWFEAKPSPYLLTAVYTLFYAFIIWVWWKAPPLRSRDKLSPGGPTAPSPSEGPDASERETLPSDSDLPNRTPKP